MVCTAVHNKLQPIGQSSSLIKNYPSSCDVHVNRLFPLPFININVYILYYTSFYISHTCRCMGEEGCWYDFDLGFYPSQNMEGIKKHRKTCILIFYTKSNPPPPPPPPPPPRTVVPLKFYKTVRSIILCAAAYLTCADEAVIHCLDPLINL